MGIELNPRLGPFFDLKLFSNGHLGMMVWTLVDFSFMAYQHQTRGHVELSLVLLTILQVIYVGDFFVNEAWYLGTIDIAHDHYGFYLSWGCFCFLPTIYTIRAVSRHARIDSLQHISSRRLRHWCGRVRNVPLDQQPEASCTHARK